MPITSWLWPNITVPMSKNITFFLTQRLLNMYSVRTHKSNTNHRFENFTNVLLTLEAKACSDRPGSTLSTMVPLSGEGPVTLRAQTKQTFTGNSLRVRTTSSWKRPFRHLPLTWKEIICKSDQIRGQYLYHLKYKLWVAWSSRSSIIVSSY